MSACTAIKIGAFDEGSNRLLLDRAGLSTAERQIARRKGAVGEMCGRFYDRHGNPVDLAIDHRIISVRLADLAAIPTTIGTAAQHIKAAAIAAALHAGIIDVIVCNLDTARRVLDS